jgi:hypothetical protein
MAEGNFEKHRRKWEWMMQELSEGEIQSWLAAKTWFRDAGKHRARSTDSGRMEPLGQWLL